MILQDSVDSTHSKTLIYLVAIDGIAMPAETTTEVGGVDVRVIITDDGYVSADVVERTDALKFIGFNEEEYVVLPTDVPRTVTEVRRDPTVFFDVENAIDGEHYWPSDTYESDGFGHGFHYTDVQRITTIPEPSDDEVTVDIDDYTVEIVAEDGSIEAEVLDEDPKETFGDYVEEIAGGWRNVVETKGDTGGDYDAAIVARASHGSMATGEWFDDLIGDDRIQIRYIGTVGSPYTDGDVPDWADEEWENRAGIFVGDVGESSS